MISKERFVEILTGLNTIKPVLVIGDIGVDKYTFGEVNRISPEAPVPVLEVTKEWHKLGLAANVGDNLQGLHIDSTILGVIGCDQNGDVFCELMERNQLEKKGIIRESNRMTTHKERIVTSTQQICRVDYETREAIRPETEQEIMGYLENFYQDYSVVILQDYNKGVVTEKLARKMIDCLRERGGSVLVDPSSRVHPGRYRGASLLKPNRKEAQVMVEQLGFYSSSPEEQAEILLRELELELVVVTLGVGGMIFAERERKESVHIPTVAQDVFDVSGAGDTALGVIAAVLAWGGSLEEACWMGNFASGVVVGKRGTARVSREELERAYQIVEVTPH